MAIDRCESAVTMPSTTVAPSTIECDGIRCDDARLAEIENGRVIVSVYREDLTHIALQDGILAPRPILQTILGFGLAALGYYPARHLIEWLQQGGRIFTVELWLIVFALVGLWLMFTAFRRGVFLEVGTVHGIKRLPFRKHPEAAALDGFVTSIEQRYGIPVLRRPNRLR